MPNFWVNDLELAIGKWGTSRGCTEWSSLIYWGIVLQGPVGLWSHSLPLFGASYGQCRSKATPIPVGVQGNLYNYKSKGIFLLHALLRYLIIVIESWLIQIPSTFIIHSTTVPTGDSLVEMTITGPRCDQRWWHLLARKKACFIKLGHQQKLLLHFDFFFFLLRDLLHDDSLTQLVRLMESFQYWILFL